MLRLALRQAEGKTLTRQETATLTRWERERNLAFVDSFLRAIPKTLYCEMSGRQVKVVNEFGTRYSVDCNEPAVDLFRVIQQLHTRVSELAAVARPHLDGDDAELEREKLKQEIGKLQKQSSILQIEIEKHMDQLVRRSSIVAGMEFLSAKLRALGTRLHSVAGQDGVDALNEFIDDLTTELKKGGQLDF